MAEPTLTELAVHLGIANAKLDLILAQSTDHEARLRVLERFRWQLAGACAAISALAGVVASHLL